MFCPGIFNLHKFVLAIPIAQLFISNLVGYKQYRSKMSSCRVCSVCVRGIFAVMAVVNGSATESVVVVVIVVQPIVETRMAIVVFHRFQQGIVDAVEIS